MTKEEKALAYDEALKWMRELYPGLHGADKEDAEHYFPQLRESEGERIRKEIIDFLETIPASELKRIPRPISEWFAYLEKQKEQKPAEWSEEDKKWLSEVYFAIDHSMYSEDERQAMKNYVDSLRKNRKTCDVDEFSLTLRNCLSADSELTKEQADTFARAYGEDLYKVALGEMKTGLDRYDIAEYKEAAKEDESK